MATEFERTGAGVLGRIARRMSVGSSVWYMGNLFDVLAGAEETGGRFALIELLSRKGTEPPRHVHAREDEAFYVLEGAVTYYVGDGVYEAGPGTFVSMPRGVPHSFVLRPRRFASSPSLRRAGSRSTAGTPASASRHGR